MVFGLNKDTVENLIILLSGIFMFNALVRLPYLGAYFEKFPLIILVLAIVLLAFKDKIANKLGNGGR